jgi:hypothetical protein
MWAAAVALNYNEIARAILLQAVAQAMTEAAELEIHTRVAL